MKIEKSILKIIEQGTFDKNLYFLPKGQLERKAYLAVNKVLELLGGKWNRKAKAHIFETDVSERIDDVLLTGEIIDKKKELQFFETPDNIIKKMIKLAEIRQGNKCLEPSAGHGKIADAMMKIVGQDNIFCIEFDNKNATILQNKGYTVFWGDFLQSTPYLGYDRVVMNPPFTKQQDIDHVLHAMECLAPSGILVSVMSLGVMFRKNKKTLGFWEKVEKYCYETIELPEKSFKESGTIVNTIILKIVKQK